MCQVVVGGGIGGGGGGVCMCVCGVVHVWGQWVGVSVAREHMRKRENRKGNEQEKRRYSAHCWIQTYNLVPV